MNNPQEIQGLTGKVTGIRVAVPASRGVKRLADDILPQDIDLRRMAEWAMNYLIRTPRPEFDYEPVFQCHPRQCPPTPSGQDVVVPCDTDARLEWEWYFMRDISGSDVGREIEQHYHTRMRKYIDPQGVVWSHVGCYNENLIDAQYGGQDRIIHIWGATKILKSLCEDYLRNGSPLSRELARKVMRALKRLAKWDPQGRCWFAAGMGALQADGTPVLNNWNHHPAPILEPLVTFYRTFRDQESIDFAIAYAEGILAAVQPGGLVIEENGAFDGHSHATMHALWGLADLGLEIGEDRYLEAARKAWHYLLSRGTGTGWFPAGPDNCNETCCISDMISVAVAIARAGRPEYFDYAERFFRNYIANLQFILTPQFIAEYRQRHAGKDPALVEKGLAELAKFQGGILGGSGLNDYENTLLGGASGFEMFGCCAPEGMRAIHTLWSNTIMAQPASRLGPQGIYVHIGLNRQAEWGEVFSFMPEAGRITVQAAREENFFIRPPSWASPDHVQAFINAQPIPTTWSGGYVYFFAQPGDELTITYPLLAFTHRVSGLWKSCAPDLEMTFGWLGNMVVEALPHPENTPLFTGKPRILPETRSIL
jgi:hypothetical protein